jgi:hypothetical protein
VNEKVPDPVTVKPPRLSITEIVPPFLVEVTVPLFVKVKVALLPTTLAAMLLLEANVTPELTVIPELAVNVTDPPFKFNVVGFKPEATKFIAPAGAFIAIVPPVVATVALKELGTVICRLPASIKMGEAPVAVSDESANPVGEK